MFTQLESSAKKQHAKKIFKKSAARGSERTKQLDKIEVAATTIAIDEEALKNWGLRHILRSDSSTSALQE